MKKNLDDLRRDRKAAADKMTEAATALQTLEAAEAQDAEAIAAAQVAFDQAKAEFDSVHAQVQRAETVEAARLASAGPGDTGAKPVAGAGAAVAGQVANPDHKAVEVGFLMHALYQGGGDREKAVAVLEREGHSGMVAALSGLTDAAGGITIPRPMAEGMIELLRSRVAVRASGARSVPMPAGELRHAKQTGGATAGYGAELAATAVSDLTFGAVDMSFKKLTALVGVSNSLLRQSGLNMAMVVRDDLLRVMALREDLAFLRNDGTGGQPRGVISWCLPGNLQTAVAATAAAAEAAVRRAVSLVEDANVGMVSPGWIMRASAKNWLAGLRDAAGYLVFPSIDQNGTLKGFPIRVSSQLPTNLGAGTNETEIVFADFSQVMIGDASAITLAMSTEAATVTGGVTTSAFQTDQTLFRAVSEHDLAPENDVAISVIRGVNWAA